MFQNSRRAVLALLLVLTTSPLAGQLVQMPTGMEEEATEGAFGLGNQDLFVPAYAFQSNNPDVWFLKHIGSGYFYAQNDLSLSGIPAFHADLSLPAGARISVITCYFYDDVIGFLNGASVSLMKWTYNTSSETPDIVQILPSVDSTDTGGYHRVFENFDETVRYRPALFSRQFYSLQLSIREHSDIRFRGCNVTWNRQVTPAPASATFTDVPIGHPYHRFVEALADAGITSGCGGGLYCVNSPITRGEMAVFLAAALGLHFPN
jgi:hypothetical protein